MIMFLAFVVVFLSVRLICQSGFVGKIAHVVLAIGVLGVADNMDNNQALIRSCIVVALAGGTKQRRAARWHWVRSVSNVSPAALQLGGCLAVIYVGRRTHLAARHRHCGAKRQK